MKTKMLSLVAVAAFAAGAMNFADPALAGKEQFVRTKPHVNVQTVAQAPAKGQTQSIDPSRGAVIQIGKHADLVFKKPYATGPLPGAPMSNYCGSNQGGGAAKSVVIAVRNQGNETAGHFMVKVKFKHYPGSHSIAYGPINPGPSADLASFQIPAQAWKNGVAPFTVTIDSENEIDEGKPGESNNVMESYCVAPAG